MPAPPKDDHIDDDAPDAATPRADAEDAPITDLPPASEETDAVRGGGVANLFSKI